MQMSMRKTAITTVVLSGVVVAATLCNPMTKPVPGPGGESTITPVQLPSVVPGFHFPEDSNVIYSWLNNKNFPNNYDSASVYNHVWGLWAGLTAQSGQVYQGDSLRIFETWLGIGDIRTMIQQGDSSCGATKTMRAQLHFPHQFEHGGKTARRMLAAKFASGRPVNDSAINWVTVAYDPNAACYALSNQILKMSVVDKYKVPGGIGAIPRFPQNAITIKPVYYVGQGKDSLIQLPVWSGPPPGGAQLPWAPTAWPTCVYVDLRNAQPPGKQVTPVSFTATDIQPAIVNANEFIHFRLDSAMAAYMNASQGSEGVNNAKAGQVALLVAMHVATKEISNWTWQTFYWAPGNTTYSPSSSLAQRLKPQQIGGAAANYQASSAYAMVLPNQPINGGTNTGVIPMIGYNPYLEAEFAGVGRVGGDSSFNINSKLIPGRAVGVQTNCMTCHSLATELSLIGYSTDQYINMDSSIFKDRIQLDFAWSIQGNLIYDIKDLRPRK